MNSLQFNRFLKNGKVQRRKSFYKGVGQSRNTLYEDMYF